MRLRDTSEGELLARIFPIYAGSGHVDEGSVPVGPGDDAAVVGAPDGSVVATTDSMVCGLRLPDETQPSPRQYFYVKQAHHRAHPSWRQG